jgi:hypothetical protein
MVRAHLSVLGGDTPTLRFQDKDGKSRVTIGVDSDGLAGLDLLDRDGKPRGLATVDATGEPTIEALDAAGRSLFKVPPP